MLCREEGPGGFEVFTVFKPVAGNVSALSAFKFEGGARLAGANPALQYPGFLVSL